MSAIDTYVANNATRSASLSGGDLPAPPSRKVAIVACMDARFEPATALGLEPGEAHVIRNAGGIVTDDAIRSLTISQRTLGTVEIMLIHHTDCGMMKFNDAELEATIQRETGVQPPFAPGAFSDLEESVRRSMARLEASPFLVNKDAIRGFIYEVETGRLREVR